MKILVVEDDINVAQSLKHLLSHFHYAVDLADNAETGLQMVEVYDYDLLLLDIALPEMDGLSMCQQLREMGTDMPILLLTGRESEGAEKAAALNVGADDYVTKPFDADELVARVQALLRRSGGNAQTHLTWGPLSVDPNSRQVSYGAKLLSLTPKEYAILELFLRNSNTVFGAAAILDRVWDSAEAPGEEVVRYHIKELRQKLTRVGAAKDFIQTVHRVGYRLNSLYSSQLAHEVEQQPSQAHVAELTAVNEQLRTALEELQIIKEELQAQNDELQETRHALEQERQRYQDLFENAPDGYLVTNRDGMILAANQVAAMLFGMPAQLLQGQPLANYIHIDDRRRFRLCLSRLSWPSTNWETRIHSPKRAPFPVTVSVSVIQDRQQGIELRWLLRDMRDRRDLEQQLQTAQEDLERQYAQRIEELYENEVFLRSIYEGAEQAIFVVDVTPAGDFRYMGYNRAAQVLSGLSLEAVFEQTPEAAFGELVGGHFRQKYQECVDAGHSIAYEEKFELDRPLWTITTLAPIKDESGRVYRLVGTSIDISDRKQAELETRKFVALAENSAEFIGMSDLSFKPFYLNPAGRQLIGAAPDQQMSDISVQDCFFPEDQDFITQEFFPKVLRDGQAEVEIRFRHLQTGEPIWMIYNVVCIRDEQGKPMALATISRDISDRKQLELSLQASEAKLSRILNNTNAAISSLRVHANREWEYEYWSAGCEKLYGYPLSRYEDKHFWLNQVVPEDREHVIMPLFDDFFAERDVTVEYRFRRQDGEVRWFTSSYSSQKVTDDCWLVIAVNQDISDRKRLELSLQKSEAQLSRIFDNAVAAIAEFYAYPDFTYTHTFMSPGCQTVYGYNQAEMLQNNDLWASRVWPEDLERVVQTSFEQIFAEETFTVEYRFLDPENNVRWIAETLISRWDATHARWTVTTVAINITDRKQAEITLQQQIRQEYLLADIAQDIRQSLSLDQVLSRTVDRVRQYLQTDRVILFRFRPDWHGDIVTESVAEGFIPILSTTIYDPCFEERFIEPYRNGHISILNDIDQADLEPCYLELIGPFQVKASLAVPILQGDNLWGLLIAHQCNGPREWQPSEIAMLRRLTTQVGIAIQQSELYERTRRELVAREQIQTVLEESEERFRTLSTAAPVGILQTTPEGICIYSNDYWQTITGLSRQDSLGAGWQQVIHPDDRTRVDQAWNDYLQSQQECQAEFRLLTQLGETRWVSSRAVTIRAADGNPIGNVCVFVDITEEKLATDKIEEQATLLDIAPDAIFVCDLEDRILYWNQGAEHLYGWTAAETICQKAHELLREDPAQLQAIMTILLDQGDWQGEMTKVTKTGDRGIVSSRWTLVRDEADQPKYILNVNTDITDQKKLEAQIFQSQKLESLGRLATGIAHDLNNVLTPILTVAQVLRLRQPALDDKSLELLQLLETSARRGAGMVKQILTVTRREPSTRQAVNLDAALQEVLTIVQRSFPKQIQINCQWPTLSNPQLAVYTVWADPTELHQVLMNLCINARDAMPEGGTLTITAEDIFIDAATAAKDLDAKEGDYILVSIADTGVGIAPEMLDRIFDPFFTTKEVGKGTGLGLAIVLGIVKNTGGFLQIQSQIDHGTTVKVYLPTPSSAPTEPSKTTSTTPESNNLQGQGEQILIVEDDLTVQQTIQSLLEAHHYATLVASNGHEAIALYQNHQAQLDLVILDITMPEMSGIELIQKLRELDATARIIAISGLPANRQPALSAGANAFLAKPYHLDTLMAEVDGLLSRSKG